MQNLQNERQKLLREKKEIKVHMKKRVKKAVKKAHEKGKVKEKARADHLSKVIQANTQDIQNLNKKIEELQEQLKKGTTPQVEGLNLEEELVKELKKEFHEDKIEHHGKTWDIIHCVNFKNENVRIILYECKETTKFNPVSLIKLKERWY